MLLQFWWDLLSSPTAGGAAGAVVAWWFNTRWKAQYEARTQKELEAYKGELENARVAATFRYQQQLQDSSLYILKRHEALATLHTLFLDAVSKILRVDAGAHSIPRLEEVNAHDASIYMEKYAEVEIFEGKRAEILRNWETDRLSSIQLLLDHLEKMRVEYAQRALVKANNFRLDHELYLPESVATAARDLQSLLQTKMLQIQPPLEVSGAWSSLVVDRDSILAAHEKLKGRARAALSGGLP